MEKLNDSDVLKFAVENGMIDFDTIRKTVEMNERKRYLAMHKSKIWQSTDSKWYTFVPDCQKKNGRRLVKRKTQEAIEDFVVDYYKELEEPITIETVFNEWLTRKIDFGEIEKQTADRYTIDFDKFFAECKTKNIQSVTTDFMDEFIVGNIKKHNLKQKAWSNLRTIIRGMFTYAKKKGYCPFNVTEYLQELHLSKKLFNHEKKPIQNVIYTEKEIRTLIENTCSSNNINDIAILFAVYTGMRVGEIVSLKWQDIGERFIYIQRTQVRFKDEDGRPKYEVRDFPKTEAGIRDVVVTPELRKLIKRMRSINPFTEYVFEKNGKCIPEHSVSTRLYYWCDKLGFPTKGMHSLRRYYATKLINAGIEESIITSQMGHADFATTKSYYYKDNSSKEYTYHRILEAVE